MKATLSERGQITIPKHCRETLGLRTGAILDFEAVDGMLVARKVQPEDMFRKWRGRGRVEGSVDSYLDRARG